MGYKFHWQPWTRGQHCCYSTRSLSFVFVSVFCFWENALKTLISSSETSGVTCSGVMGESCWLWAFRCWRRQRHHCDEREAFLCAVTQMNTVVVGEKVRGFSWYSAAVHVLAGHLTAQRALELEMMLLPPARRRWLPCHAAYAGRHKSCSVNKDPPCTTTSHSFCVLIFS